MSNPQTDEQLAIMADLESLIARQWEVVRLAGRAKAGEVSLEAAAICKAMIDLNQRIALSSSPVQDEINRLASKGQKIYGSLPPSDEPNEFIEMAQRGEMPYLVPATLTREQALANLAASDDEKAARRQSFVDSPVEPMDLDKLNSLPHVMPETHEGWNGHIPTGTGGNMKVDPVENPFPWERDTPETVAHAQSIVRKLTPEPTVADHITDELKRPRTRKTPWWKRG